MKTLLVALALAGCGFEGHDSVLDAGTDAQVPTADAAPNAATIAITDRDEPVAGVPVFFQGPDSTLVLATLTDLNGTVGAVIPDGGYVTVLLDGSLTTFADVRAGEVLHLDSNPRGPVQVVSQHVTALAPPSDPAELYTTCGGPFGVNLAQPTVVQLLGCNGRASTLLVTTDPDTGALRNAAYKAEVAIGNESMVTLDTTLAPFADAALEYVNLPREWGALSTYRAVLSPHGILYGVGGSDELLPTDPTTKTLQVKAPITPGATALVVSTGIPRAVAPVQLGEQTFYDWESIDASGAPLAYRLDLGAQLLAPYDRAPSFELDDGAVHWAERGAGAGGAANVVRTALTITRFTDPNPTTWHWRLVGGRGTEAARPFPRLPAELASLQPVAGDAVAVNELTNLRFPTEETTRRFLQRGYDHVVDVLGISTLVVEQHLNAADPVVRYR